MGNYILIAYADTYIDPNPKVGSTWQAYTDDQKNEWIDFAEQQTDNVSWIGSPTVDGQAAKFPRDFLDDAATYTRYDTVSDKILERLGDNEGIIPDDLKNAQCESIIEWIRVLPFRKLQDLQDVNVKDFGAGSVDFNFEAKSQSPLPRLAWELVYYMSYLWWRKGDDGWIRRI